MRCLLATLLISALSCGVAAAQTVSTNLNSTDAPPDTQRTSSQTPLDVPIETIAGWPGGCALLDRDFPGMRDHPMYGAFKSMSLNQVAAMSGGKITPAMMTQAAADLSSMPQTQMAARVAAP